VTAQTFNCTDMRFRSVLHTQPYRPKNADRAIFLWKQCHSSFVIPLTSSCYFCLFFSQSSSTKI